jgi:hypothetical protein
MASEHYVKSIHEMQEYFGISKVCAQYLFHRALQARKTYEKHLPYTLQLQNALVKADKCLGINWECVFFGQEEVNLMTHGIKIHDQDNKIVFRWVEDSHIESLKVEQEPGWTVVGKKKKEKTLLAAKIGIYV